MSDKKPREYYLTINDDGNPTHICLFEKLEDRPQLRLIGYSDYNKAIKALKEIESKCYGDDSIAWGIASNALEELGEEVLAKPTKFLQK